MTNWDHGSRAVAVEQTAGNTYLTDSGEIVWEESFDENPIRGDHSSNGSTWSIIEQANDTENANFYAYRNLA